MPKQRTKTSLTTSRAMLLVLCLSFSLFLIVLFVRTSLPPRESLVGPMTGLPMFERLLTAGSQTAEDSIALLPDVGRPAYAVGYSLGSQSGVALVVWDQARQRYVTVANELIAKDVSGVAAQPPKLSVESLGKEKPWIIIVRAAISEKFEGVFFALRQGNDIVFPVMMIDSSGQERPAYFEIGQLPPDKGSGTSGFQFQDINGDGVAEAVVTARSFAGGSSGTSLSTSVDVYVWRNGGFIYDGELSRVLTKASGMFPEPPKQ